jgi:hypothetical protein
MMIGTMRVSGRMIPPQLHRHPVWPAFAQVGEFAGRPQGVGSHFRSGGPPRRSITAVVVPNRSFHARLDSFELALCG